MKTITIEIPDLASDEDQILEIINGLEEIEAALEDIVLEEDSEAAELMEAAVDEVRSAADSLGIAVDLLEMDDADDEDDEDGEDISSREMPSTGIDSL